MRLDHLFDAEWRYDLIHEVAHSEAGDGRFYGQGVGTLTGRVEGTSQWSNTPRVHVVMPCPTRAGSSTSTVAGSCCSPSRGYHHLAEGHGVHVMTFQTEEPSCAWLNDVIAIGEGTIDVQHATLVMRYYECIAEVPLAPLDA